MNARALIETRLAAVVPAGVRVVHENVEDGPAADETWLLARDEPGHEWRVDRLRRRLGTYHLALHAPVNEGPGAAETTAHALAKAMEREILHGEGLVVWPGAVQRGAGELAGSWFRLPLELPYLVTEVAQ